MNALPVMKPYIGGEWIESESQKFTTIYDPSTGKPIAQVPQCTAAEVEKAIAAAKAAYPAWKNTPVRNRASIMMKLRKSALEDAKRQTVSTLIDIKVLPKTMTDGYGSWWNVGLASTTGVEAQKKAYEQLILDRAKARKY